MESLSLRGLGIALITPFDDEKNIDYAALGHVMDHVIGNGADYLVILGTTGETATLTAEEKDAVRRYCVGRNNGRVPLIAGMGGNNTRALTEEIRNANLQGYSAILSVTPFYNKPSQEGLFCHFAEVAAASNLPVVLYNVPGRTGVNLSAATTLSLAHEFPNIIAIKEASGNMKQIEEIINNRPAGFEVISGDDSLTYPLISLGAEGVISVVGNAFPREFGDMVRLCLDGDFQKALPIHYKFQKLYDELFADGNPAGIKYLLHEMGFIRNELRLPLIPTRRETGDKIDAILSTIK